MAWEEALPLNLHLLALFYFIYFFFFSLKAKIQLAESLHPSISCSNRSAISSQKTSATASSRSKWFG